MVTVLFFDAEVARAEVVAATVVFALVDTVVKEVATDADDETTVEEAVDSELDGAVVVATLLEVEAGVEEVATVVEVAARTEEQSACAAERTAIDH